MSFFSKLFKKPDSIPAPMPEPEGMDEHLVRVHIPMASSNDRLDDWFALEDELDGVVQEAKVGYLDGNEIGGGEYTIWLYGPDARPLAETVRDALRDRDLPAGCTLFLRLGGVEDDDAPEETWKLT